MARSGRKSKWTEDAVRALYAEYLKTFGRQALADLARAHGLSVHGMYNLFSRYGLPIRTTMQKARSKHWTMAQVRAIANEIQERGITVTEYAREKKMCISTLYYLLRWAGCSREIIKRRDGNGECPERLRGGLDNYIFCAWCPVSTSLGCDDWNCERCRDKKRCPCFRADLRGEKWEEAYQDWLKMRERNVAAQDTTYSNYLEANKLRNIVFDDER